jgi:hypothetical protein
MTTVNFRQELIARPLAGEDASRRRRRRAKAEGDLPPDSDPADPARYLPVVICGMSIAAAGGASRRELRSVADPALRQWPRRGNNRRG